MSAGTSLNPTEFSNRELVVFALAMCGGTTRKVHTEDIALKCHELFPGSLSWINYPDIPDKDIVRVALTDARKQEHGAFVDGRAGTRKGLSAKTKREPVPDGWILTEPGLEFIKEHETELTELVQSGRQKDHRQVARKEMRRIREHDLFAEFQSDPDGFRAPIGQLADLMRCRVDPDPSVWDRRLDKLRLVAAASEDAELIEFVGKLELSYEEAG